MSLELILGLVGGALAALFGGIGWSQTRKHGEERADRRHAEKERDDAYEIAERRARALETPEQRQRAALRELQRRRDMRDSSGRG